MKKNLYGRKAGAIKKTLLVSIVVAMFISAVTPGVFGWGEHSTTINVTFTPGGNITIDVSPKTATWTSPDTDVDQQAPDEGAADTTYTCYNNGSVPAHVYVDTNGSTDEGEWTLDPNGDPAEDNFCLQFDNNTAGSQYLTDTNSSWIGSLAAGGTNQFGIDLDLGTASGSSVLDAQNSLINITAAIVA